MKKQPSAACCGWVWRAKGVVVGGEQVGMKLLWADIRICSRLVAKVVHGKQLSRCPCFRPLRSPPLPSSLLPT